MEARLREIKFPGGHFVWAEHVDLNQAFLLGQFREWQLGGISKAPEYYDECSTQDCIESQSQNSLGKTCLMLKAG